MTLQPLTIGDLTIKYPIIQGGMGVGVSRSGLAGAVAKAGGMGVIAAAQIGYDEEDFETGAMEANFRALGKHIKKAKQISDGGAVGVNIMVALNYYEQFVKAACKAGADAIISGAGLPIELPEFAKDYPQVKLAPIVSSAKAATVILKMWDRKYKRTADFLVIEGPKAGGHLGFSEEELKDMDGLNYDEEIQAIIKVKEAYEQKYDKKIPVIVAGGIFTHEDICHVLSLGADGVQVATPFVVTKECDASMEFKQAYLSATAEDVQIVISPVGMPGRAVKNSFLERVKQGGEPVKRCYKCIKTCNPAQTPYCITKALINAVQGDVDNGLIFCGTNVERIHELTTVPQLMKKLCGEE